jgi:glycosyltransferase involved in cell wall biosynthesis
MKPIFFFPYHKIGGADRVHQEIIKSLSRKPIVLFENLGNEGFTPEFDAIAHCFYINSVKRKQAVYWIIRILSIFCTPKLFGCNSFYYYNLLSKLKNNTYNIDLTHAFSFPDRGIEFATIPAVEYLHKRIVINERTFDDYKKLYEIENINPKFLNRFEIIENGLEITAFDPEMIPSRFENFTIGFVGRNAIEKRSEVFFELHQTLNDIKGIAIGDDFYDYNKKFPKVTFLENCNDWHKVREVFKNISVLIVPSYREGFPLVIMEAMELGIPVISTPVGNIAEHVLDNENGFVAPDVDAKLFLEFAKNKIEVLKNDIILYQKLAENACLHAEKYFDIAVFRKKYKTVFGDK